jgi:hypothetical protein
LDPRRRHHRGDGRSAKKPAAVNPGFVFSVLLALSVSACVMPRAEVNPEGSLEIFSAATLSPGGRLPSDWILENENGKDTGVRQQIAVRADGRTAAITLRSGPERFMLVRRTKASLLASPYIGWAWRLQAQDAHENDIRLLIGFYGGNPQSRSWGSEPFARLGTDIPPFDRAIAVTWGRSALERGNLVTMSGAIPEYVARGGEEHEGTWWNDNIDLAQIYREAWPKDRFERVEIMFVGFAVGKGPAGAEASFSDIVLYR